MPTDEERISELERWRGRHVKDHEHLEERVRDIVRTESTASMKGAMDHVAKLDAKVGELAKETAGQTATLDLLKKHARAQSKERRARHDADIVKRKAQAENRELWEWRWTMVKRAVAIVGGPAAVAGIVQIVRMILEALKGHG